MAAIQWFTSIQCSVLMLGQVGHRSANPDPACHVHALYGRLSLYNETTDPRTGYNTYCLKTNVLYCDPSTRCCDMDLYKIVLFMNNGCWGSVQRLTINGCVGN